MCRAGVFRHSCISLETPRLEDLKGTEGLALCQHPVHDLHLPARQDSALFVIFTCRLWMWTRVGDTLHDIFNHYNATPNKKNLYNSTDDEQTREKKNLHLKMAKERLKVGTSRQLLTYLLVERENKMLVS